MNNVYEFLQEFLDFLFSCLKTIYDYFFSNSIVLKKGRRVDIKELIGEGAFSFVYRAKDQNSKQNFALKKIICQSHEQIIDAEEEMKFHELFSHPNLLPLVDWAILYDNGNNPVNQLNDSNSMNSSLGNGGRMRSQNNNQFFRLNNAPDGNGVTTAYMLFPYLGKTSLREEINLRVLEGKRYPWTEESVLKLFCDIVEGVKEIHSKSVIHLDLKPENIILAEGRNNPVIIDYGSMQRVPISITSKAQAGEIQEMAAMNATLPYRAPELFYIKNNAIIDSKVDIWSLGCILYAMAYGYSPFECELSNDNSGTLRVVECTYLRIIGSIQFPSSALKTPSQVSVAGSFSRDMKARYSNEFNRLIEWCLNQDPLKRPDSNMLYNKINDMLNISHV